MNSTPAPEAPVNPAAHPARSPFSRKKRRPDDVLGNLPEDDQDQVLAWVESMSYREAAEQIAKPRPEGLGLKTYPTSLRQFYKKRAHQDLEFCPEMFAPVPDVGSDPTFARICHALEQEILLGLDRFEDRDQTIKFLSAYARLRALQLRSSKTSHRDKFHSKAQWYTPGIPAGDPSFQNPPASEEQSPTAAATPPLSEPLTQLETRNEKGETERSSSRPSPTTSNIIPFPHGSACDDSPWSSVLSAEASAKEEVAQREGGCGSPNKLGQAFSYK